MSERQVIAAELTWTGRAFERDVMIVVGGDGRIEQVGRNFGEATRTMGGRAIVPGFVNAHSHAFQRGLRGRGETFPAGAGSFWTWREAMYDLVGRMDTAAMYRLSRQAFDEMLTAGITTVGEFHYLHHDERCEGHAFDDVVLEAASDAGIRIALLSAFYRHGGIGEPLSGGQLRFRTPDLDAYRGSLDRLAALPPDPRRTLGVVAHSIRAATPDEIAALHDEARRRGLVFHMHIEEQPLEIEQAVAAYGRTPMAIVNDRLDVGSDCTFVHCTHTAPGDLEACVDAGANVCLCPLTEANLGDGLADAAALRRAVCLGTDSNARICFTEEMRWLEYGQRLRELRRGVFVDDDGENARTLLEAATVNGARALGLETGRISPGCHADLVAIDLDEPALRETDEATLLPALVLGTGNDAIAEVCVGGRWRERRSGGG